MVISYKQSGDYEKAFDQQKISASGINEDLWVEELVSLADGVMDLAGGMSEIDKLGCIWHEGENPFSFNSGRYGDYALRITELVQLSFSQKTSKNIFTSLNCIRPGIIQSLQKVSTYSETLMEKAIAAKIIDAYRGETTDKLFQRLTSNASVEERIKKFRTILQSHGYPYDWCEPRIACFTTLLEKIKFNNKSGQFVTVGEKALVVGPSAIPFTAFYLCMFNKNLQVCYLDADKHSSKYAKEMTCILEKLNIINKNSISVINAEYTQVNAVSFIPKFAIIANTVESELVPNIVKELHGRKCELIGVRNVKYNMLPSLMYWPVNLKAIETVSGLKNKVRVMPPHEKVWRSSSDNMPGCYPLDDEVFWVETAIFSDLDFNINKNIQRKKYT